MEPDLNAEGSPRGINAMQTRADGKLVVAGLGRAPGGLNAFQFGRYLSNGQLDPSFGTGGMTTVPIPPAGDALALDEAPDGKLVATGGSAGGGTAAVVRVTEDGEPDSTFNAVPKGIQFVDVPGSTPDEGFAVQVLNNGTVLIGGLSENGAFLAELDANGKPVPDFGTAGIAVHDMGTDTEPSGKSSTSSFWRTAGSSPRAPLSPRPATKSPSSPASRPAVTWTRPSPPAASSVPTRLPRTTKRSRWRSCPTAGSSPPGSAAKPTWAKTRTPGSTG